MIVSGVWPLVMNESEHREAPRIARSFLVRYRSLGNGPQAWLVSPLHDFSLHGARFMSERPFIVGDALELQLVLPVVSQPVRLTAKVAWTKLGKLGLVEVGIIFDPVEAGIQQTLERAVNRFLHS